MASLAARQVAFKVLGSVRKGERPNITKSALEVGYKYNTANTAKVQKTKSYKEIINPALERMSRIRENALKEMERKDLSEERFDTLARTVTSLTHDIQLLSGGKTENISVEEDRRILLGIVAQLRGDNTEDIRHRIEK